MNSDKQDIRKIKPEVLTKFLDELGVKAFRKKQIEEWIWQKSVRNFDEMTNLSKELRAKLKERFEFPALRTHATQKSTDGTIKTRFQLKDGAMIESVLIPVVRDKRFTVCVSSQVGCSLDCAFCATGKMKRMRNLDAAEIYDQVVLVNAQSQAHFDHPLTNIVFMGMGEPLLAYKSVRDAITRITDQRAGLGMSPRRITVSTAGIAKMIHKLAEEEVRFNLALSLHAANDKKRDQIMSINESNNLSALMDALKAFDEKAKGKISYEYIALKNFNTSIQDAKELESLCRDFPVKVNIIEYNKVDGVPFEREDERKTDAFADYLNKKGITATIRRSRGKDIDAACGQLANKGND